MKDAKYSVQFNKANRQVNGLSAAGIKTSVEGMQCNPFLRDLQGLHSPVAYIDVATCVLALGA